MKRERSWAVIAAWAACLLMARGASAQFDLEFGDPIRIGNQAPSATATVTARLEPAAGDEVLLSITVETSADAWTYAVGGAYSGKTEIHIAPEAVVGLTAVDEGFTPDHAPKREVDPTSMEDVDKFPGGVTWTRRYRLDGSTNAPEITGTIKFNLCNANECTRPSEDFTATLAGETNAPPPVEDVASPSPSDTPNSALSLGYQIVPERRIRPGETKPDPVQLQFQLTDAGNGEWLLTIVMQMEEGWRTYALEPTEEQFEVPTTIRYIEMAGLETIGEPETLIPFVQHHNSETDATANSHEGQAAWSQRFQQVGPGPIGLKGTIQYQLCKDICLAPLPFSFSLGSLQSADDVATASTPTLAVSNEVKLDIQVPETQASGNIALQLLLAFLGGLILNVMPCVLPVIAIKILSFVQQAGESRAKVMALNLSYTAGVLSVFLTLATLAMAISLGWGTQFQNVIFTMSMAAVVFVMALSLLGVFEIPIPGFAGSGEQREGLPGAFMTGIIATLLGVPCTGPLMAAVFAWALKQPPAVTYAVFTSMGLGMASPYFMAGFFPGIVNLLPKPGMWMERFKQFLGFILMGTVIWLIYVLPDNYKINFMVFLLGLSMGFWMIGSMYNQASPAGQKWRVRLSALSCIGLVSVMALFLQFGFNLGFGEDHHLPWEPFSELRMTELVDEGRPVLIDFTANWCQICKTNEFVALNRAGTKKFIEEHNVATLMADYTQENPEIKKWLNRFEQDSVPLTVIIPPRRGAEQLTPILISGPYSQETLLEKLEQAIASGAQTAEGQSANEVSQR